MTICAACGQLEIAAHRAQKFPSALQINLAVNHTLKPRIERFLSNSGRAGARKWWHMASIDIQEYTGPKRDRLGFSCFAFHLMVGAFVLAGWLISSYDALVLYLVLLPVMATQWAINRGSCIINNVESWLRTGHWRDPENPEEGGFLLMLCDWLFTIRPSPLALDRFSYVVVVLLWLLALGHFSWLAMV